MSDDHDLGNVLRSGVTAGLYYKVVQNPKLGHFCGYVQTQFGSGWTYDDLRGDMSRLVDCHGGLTYGVDQRGYVGFDCAHAGDVCILNGDEVSDHAIDPCREWTPEDVENECQSLARQLSALEMFAEKFDERGWSKDD